MGMLTSDQVQEFRMLHGHTFVAVCDKCDTLIKAGELFISESRKKGLRLKGARTICYDTLACSRKTDVDAATKYEDGLAATKVRRSKKAMLQEKLGDVTIEPSVRRAILKILAEDTESKFDTKLLVTRLLRKSSMREFKKGVLRSTIKGMRIKKEIKRRKGQWFLATAPKKETVNA